MVVFVLLYFNVFAILCELRFLKDLSSCGFSRNLSRCTLAHNLWILLIEPYWFPGSIRVFEARR